MGMRKMIFRELDEYFAYVPKIGDGEPWEILVYSSVWKSYANIMDRSNKVALHIPLYPHEIRAWN